MAVPHLGIFRERAGTHMRAAPVVVPADAGCADVVGAMAAAAVSAAVVVGAAGRMVGIVTEQDVARRIAFRLDAATPVAAAMTSPVRSVRADDFLYHAIARMRGLGLRHMAVTGADGRPVGMLYLDDALGAGFGHRLRQIDSLTRDGTVDGLRQVKTAQVALAEELFAESLPVPEIQQLLTHVNNDIYRRVVEMALAAMAAEGMGPPPVPFAVIVMGSGGRGESFLFPDQDNGFILDDYDDAAHARIDPFFIELAERMTRDLDAVGFPLCRGHVMATNPVWRKTLSQWRAQISLWCRRRSTVALRLSDIFFDFRAVYGEDDLASRLRAHVTASIARSPLFLSELYEDSAAHGVALGWFGRFVTERSDPDHQGEVNLKHAGTLPLVEAVRLLALREGVAAVGTLDRLDALREAEVVTADEHEHLVGAFRHITALMLRQQMADYAAGREVGNFVPPDALSARDRDLLVDAFRSIDRLRGQVRTAFTGSLF